MSTQPATETAPETVDLSVKERLILRPLLPQQSSLLTIKVVRELAAALEFSEAEIAAYELRAGEGGQLVWRADVPQETAIPIGPAAREIIVTALKKLDEEGNVTLEHLSLFEKFIPE